MLIIQAQTPLGTLVFLGSTIVDCEVLVLEVFPIGAPLVSLLVGIAEITFFIPINIS